jgi:hypothetical protein
MGALALLGWNFWRARQFGRTLTASTVAIVGVWIAIPSLFIARHFACGTGGTSAVCTAFVVPVHHWMFYLQSALACVFGYAAVSVVTPRGDAMAAGNPDRASFTTIAAATGAVVMACALLSFRPMDEQMRQRAMDMRNRVDLELYEWLLTNTGPDALFVTDISTNAVHDTAAMAVLAAGRKSVALPFTYSNPYVDWQTRKQREEAYLAAALSEKDQLTLCPLLPEAGRGNRVYIALASGTNAPPGQLQPVFRSKQNSVYSVMPSVCSGSLRPSGGPERRLAH